MADHTLITAGDRLRWLISKSGLSQRSLSLAAGLSASFLGAFFTRDRRDPGSSPLDAESAEKIAKALGVSRAWVLWGDDVAPEEVGVAAAGERIREAGKLSKGEHAADNASA